MRFYSDILNKFFDSANECETAEKEELAKREHRANLAHEAEEALKMASNKVAEYYKQYGALPSIEFDYNCEGVTIHWNGLSASKIKRYGEDTSKEAASKKSTTSTKTAADNKDTSFENALADFFAHWN